MKGTAVSVDGEEGFTARLHGTGLVLRKGDLYVRIPPGEVRSAVWSRRDRYPRLLFRIGIVLLVALGLGVVLIALYYLSRYEALVITSGDREYALFGDRAGLEKIQKALRTRRSGAADEEKKADGITEKVG
jgi:hypothetical protein